MATYRLPIDGLRALAVLAVILYHYFPSLCPGGYTGVDVFFVISGYLITRVLMRGLDEREITLWQFYQNRIIRILPSLIVLLLALLLLGWVLLLPDDYQLLGRHVLSSAGLFENYQLLSEDNYFGASSDIKPLLHLWSLSLEEQFYVFWPLLFLALGGSRKWIKYVLPFAVYRSFSYCFATTNANQPLAFFSPFARCWELGVGAAVALYTPDVPAFLDKLPWRWPALLALLSSFFLLNPRSHFPGPWALLPVLGTAFLIYDQRGVIERILSLPALTWLGRVSYPLYLWHWPLLVVLRLNAPLLRAGLEPYTGVKLVALVVATALAALTYYGVEKPIADLRERFRGKLALVLVLILGCVADLGHNLDLEEGFKRRFANYFPEDRLMPQGEVKFESCLPTQPRLKAQWCETTNQLALRDVVLVGDSHATVLAPQLASYYRQRKRDLTVVGTGATPGLMGVGIDVSSSSGPRKIREMESVFAWILASPPKTVILVSRGPYYFEGRGVGQFEHEEAKLVELGLPESKHPTSFVYLRGLERSLKLLTAARIEVIFIYDNFELGFSPLIMCQRPPTDFFGFSPLEQCALPISRVKDRRSRYLSNVETLLRRFTEVRSFDLNQNLCDQNWCRGVRDGELLYSDDNHLNLRGTQRALEGYRY